MLDLILLYFLAKHVGSLAVKKGLPPLRWKITMITAWLIFEMAGLLFGVVFFGTGNLYRLMAFGLVCAFGGYLLIRYILEKKPDQNTFDDINNIGRS
ncbi:MAG TPA: hypothetical protein PKY28_05550 [Ferruginibacter sp.]|nr:hypothetical protein [Ferruginibacter sp.]